MLVPLFATDLTWVNLAVLASALLNLRVTAGGLVPWSATKRCDLAIAASFARFNHALATGG